MTWKSLVIRGAILLAASRLMLDRRGTTKTLNRLCGRRRAWAAVEPNQALRAVRRAAKTIGGVCLPQAVALTALLERGGLEPTLVLGCRREEDGGWTAHAWVELDGAVLEPIVANQHDALARLDARNGWIPSPPVSGS